MKGKNSKNLSEGVKSILIRNLCYTGVVKTKPPSPSIQIFGVHKGEVSVEEELCNLFEGDTLPTCCNPSWSGSQFKYDILQEKSEINELIIKVFDESNDIGEETHGKSERVLMQQFEWDLSKVVRLGGHISLANISALPLNAMFIATEDGGLLVDEKLYMTLRSNGLITVASKHNAEAEDNEVDEYSLQQEEKRRGLLNTVKSSESAIQAHQQSLEEIIANMGATNSSQQLEMRRRTLEKLRLEVTLAEEEVKAEQLAEQEEISHLHETAEAMKRSRDQCRALREAISSSGKELESKREELLRTKFILEARQMKLFTELVHSIYPIEMVSSAAVGSSATVRSEARGAEEGPREEEYTIRGIELPMVIDTSLKDDEQISSALGYVVHLLVLATKYLQIPLRYEVIYCSSRSMIRDAVIGSGRALPLFKRGVERERFDRALLWLQKDVEQLILLRGYTYDRKKSILGNLKQLFSCEMCPKLVS